ncbi:hypothetical protein [Limnoglobus roseus]|uniref:Uncharacterized protein n=1 Tax=Limnoglobus roseus TaxID=2598579 RepID=A0A5C1A8G5_9BACT|nr:hypothetical protein [Limnoglobus roseus]QEL15619.1 hypothetical protein PX52LOC_02552 [Limnoglobus roseus]
MASDLINADEVDRRFLWLTGTAEKLAKKSKLPHYRLPDGSLRFVWAELESLICRIPPAHPQPIFAIA